MLVPIRMFNKVHPQKDPQEEGERQKAKHSDRHFTVSLLFAGLENAFGGWFQYPLGRNEFQRSRINTISQPGRWRAVVKQMSLMAAASGAMHFGTRINQFPVSSGLNDVL